MAQSKGEQQGLMDVEVSVGGVVGGGMEDGTARAEAAAARPAAPAAGGGAAADVVDMFRKSSHPVTAMFHVAFKLAALVLYLFGNWFSGSFVVVFVLSIVCLAFDFWTVKNVSGRLMVGLRWWNEIAEDGSNVWRFESIENPDEVSAVDYRIFWYSLYLNQALWVLFGFVDLIEFKFKWLLLVGVALTLNASNISGYWQCSKDARAKLEGAVKGAVQQHAANAFASSISSSISSAFSGAGGSAAART